MIEASKLRAGMTFVTADGKLIRVLEASHHKPGKGNTIMRMKLRDVRTGSTFDTSYRPEEKFEQAILETVPAQYLYQMDDTAYFMNTETYDQYEIPVVNVENELLYILENSEVKIQFYGNEVIGVTVPTTVELTVTETQPSIKGATVTGSGKPATMETGLVVNVPDFIEAGQKLVINTAEGTYVSREQFGDIVIAPRVLEKIIAIATAKVEGVYSLENKSVSDSLSKRSLGRGVYLHTEEDGQVSVDIYLYLEYGVAVPSVAVAIQKAVKSAVYDMADVTLDAVNIHVVGIATEKSPKPDLKDLFNEDFLND